MAKKKRNLDLEAIAAKLDAVEAEMKSIGFWDDGPPPEKTGNFLEMPFESWLQWVFLKNARTAVETGVFPDKSQVGLMAMRQYDYHSYYPEAQELVRLLHRFDDLVNV